MVRGGGGMVRGIANISLHTNKGLSPEDNKASYKEKGWIGERISG